MTIMKLIMMTMKMILMIGNVAMWRRLCVTLPESVNKM